MFLNPDDRDDITRTYVPLAKDTVIGHYRIISKIGAGGMGEVYLVEDTQLHRKSAIKFLPSHRCEDADSRARFEREAQAAAKVSHPNIVTVHEFGEFHGRPYIVTEYVGELTLRDLIRDDSLEPGESINIIIQVCEGLQEAHSAGVVHRDIKPSNIVLEKHHHPKIVDFGLAWVQGAGKVTRTGSTMGTISYMSPEQLKGQPTDHRTDLFSVGVMLYEMITGKNPFATDSDPATQYKILSEQPEPMARYKSGLPEGLQEVVDRALEKDAEVRYQSAADLVADLKRLRRRSSDTSRTGTSEHSTLPLRLRNYKYILAAAAVIVGAIVVWETFQSGPTGRSAKRKHLVVLPFVNLSDAAVGQTLCDGLEEVITSKLTQLAEFEGSLEVVPSSEVRERGIVRASQARRTFGVDLAVTGSVQEHGGGVRMTLNLVDAGSQRQLRSAVIDKGMSDIFVLQDEVVTELAQMLDIQLQPDSRRILDAGRTASSGAYYSYLKGRGYLQRFESAANLDSAAMLFQSALGQDSSFALAWAGVGEVYFQKYLVTKDVQFVAPAVANASRALELNDRLAPVLITLGSIHRVSGDYEEAARYLRQAIQIDSLNYGAYRELAVIYEELGRVIEAEACYRTAVRLRPDDWRNYYYLSLFNVTHGHRNEAVQQAATAESLAPAAAYPSSFLGGLYLYLGMTDKAKELAKKAIAIEPDYISYSNLGTIYQYEKAYQNAADMYVHALKIQGTDFNVWINLASTYLKIPGAHELARAAFDSAIVLAEKIRKVNPNDALLLVNLADCYARTGRREEAIDLARQAVQLPSGSGEVLVRAGIVFESVGLREEALKLIGRAVVAGYAANDLRAVDDLANLVADARFDSTIRAALRSSSAGK